MRAITGVTALLASVLLAGCAGGPPAESDSSPAVSSPGASSPAVSSPAVSSPTGSAPASPPVGRKVHLALGDSLTAGFQNATGDDKGGAYPALLALTLEREGLPLTVENLACTGESTTELLTGGRCHPPPTSQLREAERIAAVRRGDMALVTLFIGANDVLRCISTGSVDRTCLAEGEQTYRDNLPQILQRLRTAVGPDVPIAVLTYYDPFQQTIAGRTPSENVRQGSAEGTERLNAALTEAAQGVGASVVDLRGLIEGRDGRAVCTMTSVCSTGDFHFNATSNAAVADLLHQKLAPVLLV